MRVEGSLEALDLDKTRDKDLMFLQPSDIFTVRPIGQISGPMLNYTGTPEKFPAGYSVYLMLKLGYPIHP